MGQAYEELLTSLRQLIAPVVGGEGMELADLELKGSPKKRVLRVFIDKADGVNLRDCEIVSRQLSAILDVEDPIAGSYVLEVSSPGLDRPLKTDKDFMRSVGKLVKIKTAVPKEGKRIFQGRIKGFGERVIHLALPEGGEVLIPLGEVSSARLEVDF